MAHRAVIASLLLLPQELHASCPINTNNPYMNEKSPFGYPLAPGAWDWNRQECWTERYAMCNGAKQAPVDIDLSLNQYLCKTKSEGSDGALKSVAQYTDASDHSDVQVSEYMRTVMVEGKFGTMTLMDGNGADVVYEATQVHLTVDSLHHVNGSGMAGEMIVLHKRQGGDMKSGVLAVSVLFQESEDHASSIFTSLGFASDSKAMNQEMTSSWKVPAFSIAPEMDNALMGPSYQYEGSVPVPPCHETVNWIVLTDAQHVSKFQTSKLRSILQRHAGGTAKRTPVPRNSGSACRDFRKNSNKLGSSDAAESCSSMGAEAARVAVCWADTPQCAKSPIDIEPASAGVQSPTTAAGEVMNYEAPEHIAVQPSMYTLDATVPHGGNFGYLLLNGRKFEATKVSVKPVSAHTINGVTYEAELMIEHRMYGDDLGAAHGGSHDSHGSGGHAAAGHDASSGHDAGGHGAMAAAHGAAGGHDAGHAAAGHEAGHAAAGHDADHAAGGHDAGHAAAGHDAADHAAGGHASDHAAGEHTADHAAGEAHDAADHGSMAADHGDGHGTPAHDDHAGGHGGHRRLSTDHGHTVMLSVPLKVGKESALLRKLGLGDPENKQAIRDGNSYDVHDSINLGEELGAQAAGSWIWYSGSPITPGCPAWGVRWMVMETPMEISFTQLNYLNLPVSGVDSTRTAVPVRGDYYTQVVKDYLPDYAVDSDAGECDANAEWNYENARCWRMHYPECSGEMQSPINILSSAVAKKGSDNMLARMSWKPAKELQVKNTGKHLQVVSNQLGYTQLTGDDGFVRYFQAVSMNVHAPSEHMIDGKQYPMEIQIIHKRQRYINELENDHVLVTSFMFEMGEPSKLLEQLYVPGGDIPVGGHKVVEKPIDLQRAFGPALDGEFYRYDGSVTAPNCAEVAKWFVFTHPFTLSEAQWQAMKALFPNPSNNRPVQPLNGRPIAKNSFEEGTYVDYHFFLGRETARNRATPDVGIIMVPIIGSLLLCSAIMLSTFVFEDSKKKKESAGGLEEKIGKSFPPPR